VSDKPEAGQSAQKSSAASGDGGREQDILTANDLLAPVVGQRLVQFRMGYGIHLELGHHFEVTIETALTVADGSVRWSGEPLTAEAAGALLPLNLRLVTSAKVDSDGTLNLGFGEATLLVPPHPMYEAWQVLGPRGLLIVCSPGGDYLAIWKPEGES
jgi:Family of unknown function (DUF6188)